jgi:hypothetical protein
MKRIFRSLTATTAALAATFIGYTADAQNSGGTNHSESDLSDQLLSKGLFNVSPDQTEIVLDQEALVATIRAEVLTKLRNRNLNPDVRTVYEKLAEGLKPGSFSERDNGAKDLQSMHFDKKIDAKTTR